jgi:hypothetical protein
MKEMSFHSHSNMFPLMDGPEFDRHPARRAKEQTSVEFDLIKILMKMVACMCVARLHSNNSRDVL